jgi:hypothetical protein
LNYQGEVKHLKILLKAHLLIHSYQNVELSRGGAEQCAILYPVPPQL